MLLVLFTMVSARLDSIMLTMLFSGYNIDTPLSLIVVTAERRREVITLPARPLNNVYIRLLLGCSAGWLAGWRVADPAPLTSDIAISIKFLAGWLAGWLGGSWLAWLTDWLTLLPYLLVHNWEDFDRQVCSQCEGAGPGWWPGRWIAGLVPWWRTGPGWWWWREQQTSQSVRQLLSRPARQPALTSPRCDVSCVSGRELDIKPHSSPVAGIWWSFIAHSLSLAPGLDPHLISEPNQTDSGGGGESVSQPAGTPGQAFTEGNQFSFLGLQAGDCFDF